jgi:hypothetical protein
MPQQERKMTEKDVPTFPLYYFRVAENLAKFVKGVHHSKLMANTSLII